MSDRKDNLVSYYLIGRKPTGVFMLPLTDNVPSQLSSEDVLVLDYMCRQNQAEMVGTLRCRKDDSGKLEYFRGYLNEPPTEQDEATMTSALCHLCVSGTGSLENFGLTVDGVLEGIDLLKQLGGE